MASFMLTTLINAPKEVVFDLSRDIDFHVRSMADSNERAVGGTTSGLIVDGEWVTWKASHFGVPFTMTSTITEMDPPNRFVDQQSKGPFKRFRHEHRFSAAEDGTTVMVDEIDYEAPLGPVGRVVDAVFLGRYMEKLIAQRNDLLKHEAESSL